MECAGNSSDHCCHLGKHGVCVYLEENTVPGRRWACGLYRELGSWERVHATSRYAENVQPFWDQHGDGSGSCGNWPTRGELCGTCGEVG